MDIEKLTILKLKKAIRDAGIIGEASYEENELRPVLLSFLESLDDIALEVCKPYNSLGLLCALEHYIPIHIMKPKVGFEGDVQILFNNAASLANFAVSSALLIACWKALTATLATSSADSPISSALVIAS